MYNDIRQQLFKKCLTLGPLGRGEGLKLPPPFDDFQMLFFLTVDISLSDIIATPATSFRPTSTDPLPLLHHLQPGVRFFAMLRQLNLARPTASQFDPTRHICRGDIVMAPPDLQILVRLTKTHQSVSRAPVLPIPEVPGHPMDMLWTRLLLTVSSSHLHVPHRPGSACPHLHSRGALHHGHCLHILS